jgi:putative copper resistance protein D
MNCFGAGIDGPIDGPMAVIRAIHFAATAMTAGALMFRAWVAAPALRATKQPATAIDGQIRRVAWIGLAVTLVSGALWLMLQSSSMSGESCRQALTSGAIITVLDETQFGLVSEIRLAFSAVLAICLAHDRPKWSRWLSLGAGLCLLAGLAWSGHAASTTGDLGYLHLAADALHLCAAAAWVGGLVPLALLLASGRRDRGAARAPLERDAVGRFSLLGIASVATLIVSGGVNAWILVGSFRGLVMTGYGWLLLSKLCVFVIMVGFAAVNRFRLTPRLALATDGAARIAAREQLTRNVVVEIVLGVAIYCIVGVLGMQHPAVHLMM